MKRVKLTKELIKCICQDLYSLIRENYEGCNYIDIHIDADELKDVLSGKTEYSSESLGIAGMIDRFTQDMEADQWISLVAFKQTTFENWDMVDWDELEEDDDLVDLWFESSRGSSELDEMLDDAKKILENIYMLDSKLYVDLEEYEGDVW